MKTTINQKTSIFTTKILMVIAYLLMSFTVVIVLFTYNGIEYTKWLDIFSIINLIHLSFTYFILNRLNFKWVSFSGFFIVLGYLFHFGHVYLNFLNYSFPRIPNYLTLLITSDIRETLLYVFAVFIMTILGIILSINPSTIHIKKNNESIKYYDNLKTIRIAAILVLFISLPVTLYVELQGLVMVSQGIYSSSYGIESGIITVFSDFTFTGFTLLILSYANKKKTAFFLSIFTMLFYALTMVSGTRGNQIIFILLIIYINHKVIYKINWKSFLIILIVSYVGIALVNTIAVFRQLSNPEFRQFVEIMEASLASHPFYELLSETGASIQTPYEIIRRTNINLPQGYGETFYKSFLTILPNINGVLNEVVEDINYVYKLNIPTLGGSYTGELYYNFAELGAIVATFFGYLIQKLSDKMEYNLESGRFYEFSYLVPIFIFGIWWVRNSFAAIIRFTAWNLILLVIIKFILKNLSKNK